MVGLNAVTGPVVDVKAEVGVGFGARDFAAPAGVGVNAVTGPVVDVKAEVGIDLGAHGSTALAGVGVEPGEEAAGNLPVQSVQSLHSGQPVQQLQPGRPGRGWRSWIPALACAVAPVAILALLSGSAPVIAMTTLIYSLALALALAYRRATTQSLGRRLSGLRDLWPLTRSAHLGVAAGLTLVSLAQLWGAQGWWALPWALCAGAQVTLCGTALYFAAQNHPRLRSLPGAKAVLALVGAQVALPLAEMLYARTQDAPDVWQHLCFVFGYGMDAQVNPPEFSAFAASYGSVGPVYWLALLAASAYEIHYCRQAYRRLCA